MKKQTKVILGVDCGVVLNNHRKYILIGRMEGDNINVVYIDILALAYFRAHYDNPKIFTENLSNLLEFERPHLHQIYGRFNVGELDDATPSEVQDIRETLETYNHGSFSAEMDKFRDAGLTPQMLHCRVGK